jgi:hypothetical protein
MEMWRYFPTDAERADPDLHPFLRDGRWRWLPHDLEASWNIYGGSAATVNTIHNILRGGAGNPQWQGTSALLNAVLARPDMRERFANTLVDLMEGVLAPDNVIATLNSMTARITNELSHAIDANIIQPQNPNWPTISAYRDNWDRIRAFARARPDAMLGFIGRDRDASSNSGLGLNSSNRRALTVTTSAGGGAVMNSRLVPESSAAVGNYYHGSAITVTARPYPGYVVSHWIVDGEPFEASESVSVTMNAAQTVRVVFRKCDTANLQITAISAARDDYIEIHNPTDRVISARGLYLSDSGSNLHKWRMPHMIVRPGATVTVVMRSSIEDESTLKRGRTNFNLAFRETLRLVDRDGNVLQNIEVTRMRRDEAQYLGRDGNWRLERDRHLPPPEPPPAVFVPVRLMAQDTDSWARRESPVVQIIGDGTYTATMTLPPSANLVSLSLASDGATFNWPEGFSGVPRAPASWSSARVEFTSVSINGDAVGINWSSDLVRRGDDSAGGGRVNLELWAGWWEPNQRLTGVVSVPTYGDSTSFARSDGAPITSISVTFRVTGVPE